MSGGRNCSFKLIVFDLDGTLTRERSIWEYIHKRLGTWYGFAETFQERFLRGEISYEEFCDLDAQVWKGMKIDDLSAIARTVPFREGVDSLIEYLKQKGLKLALVSSGLSLLTSWVHQRYGFDDSISNDLLHEDGILTGKVHIRVYHDKKAVWVRRILQRFRIPEEEMVAIGDSRGDLDMIQMAGFSIALNPSCRDLEEAADLCFQSDNLAEIIPQLPF
jgi:phosphoserine phosphatase